MIPHEARIIAHLTEQAFLEQECEHAEDRAEVDSYIEGVLWAIKTIYDITDALRIRAASVHAVHYPEEHAE